MPDPQRNASPWLAIRVGLLAVAFISSGAFIASVPDDFSHPSWSFLPKMMALVAGGMVFVLGLQKINPSSTATWDPPRWSSNPFRLADPLAFFDFSAWYLISMGLGCFLLGMLRHPRNWAWELPISAGIGMWIGTSGL
jgi:hypothetical protein